MNLQLQGMIEDPLYLNLQIHKHPEEFNKLLLNFCLEMLIIKIHLT